MKVFTIGYAGKSAATFCANLAEVDVRQVVDVRLYSTSQLAGYAKRADLEYLLRRIVPAGYVHTPMLAPTKRMLDGYKKQFIDWKQYEVEFNDLIAARGIEELISPDQAHKGCFLCSEARPDNCHRRLVAEYLSKQWGNVDICRL